MAEEVDVMEGEVADAVGEGSAAVTEAEPTGEGQTSDEGGGDTATEVDSPPLATRAARSR